MRRWGTWYRRSRIVRTNTSISSRHWVTTYTTFRTSSPAPRPTRTFYVNNSTKSVSSISSNWTRCWQMVLVRLISWCCNRCLITSISYISSTLMRLIVLLIKMGRIYSTIWRLGLWGLLRNRLLRSIWGSWKSVISWSRTRRGIYWGRLLCRLGICWRISKTVFLKPRNRSSLPCLQLCWKSSTWSSTPPSYPLCWTWSLPAAYP